MGIKIALAGNPNAGKTTLFNALTGSNQYVGNWPGVTVEKKEGKLKADKDVTLTDLPGIYSLSPYTLEEVVARNYLVGERPDAILNIIDGTNIERNLYLTTQLIELGIPVVACINMMDVVEKNGDKINIELLAKKLGCEVVEISALKGTGIDEAAQRAIDVVKKNEPIVLRHNFCGSVEHAIAHIEEASFLHDIPEVQQRWYAVKIFERDEKVLEQLLLPEDVLSHIEKDIQSCERELDDDAESIITNERYNYITAIVKECYKRKNTSGMTTSDKIDKIVTNRILALPIFAFVMFLVYKISIGTIGDWTVGFMNDTLFGEWIVPGVTKALESINCADWLVSLIADGIVGGVGAVLGFVPQMIILFLLLSILEDVGYISRVAFIMDRIFRKFGLSGKSFIPMLIGTGCGVPGIMASRTIENERDRRMTIITTTFIPCGAKMPMVGLIAGALFNNSWIVAGSAYFIGVAAVIVSGIMLKKTKPFQGEAAPFVMELPSYHAPIGRNVFRATWERGWSFIKKAGTVIVIASILIWLLNSITFEGGFHYIGDGDEKSILNVIGETIAVVFAPLGFGKWQAAVATILGLVAKEEIVGVFGSLTSMGADAAFAAVEEGGRFAEIGSVIFGGNKLSAFSFMIFNLLCAPCFAAMGAIKREMNSAKWTAFAIGYQCAFAYAVSLCVYQIGMAVTGNMNVIGLIVSAVIIGFVGFMLFKPHKEGIKLTSDVAAK
ncbi:MAG: ferrous iron transport protein B [Oscillospiraceae bacterium]|nr:ferrous iron transport protein B [Oscillospiraceae bacterium]